MPVLTIGELRHLLRDADPDLELAVIVDGSGELRELVDVILDDEPVRLIAASEAS